MNKPLTGQLFSAVGQTASLVGLFKRIWFSVSLQSKKRKLLYEEYVCWEKVRVGSRVKEEYLKQINDKL